MKPHEAIEAIRSQMKPHDMKPYDQILQERQRTPEETDEVKNGAKYKLHTAVLSVVTTRHHRTPTTSPKTINSAQKKIRNGQQYSCQAIEAPSRGVGQ